MISLEEVKPFAEGGNRVCYIHPDNKNLCLKISKPEVVKKMRSNAPWYKKLRSERSFDDNYREESAYQQRAIKENPEKILMIGLGGATVAKALNILVPNARLDIVEINPAIPPIVADYFEFGETHKNHIFVAILFLQGTV